MSVVIKTQEQRPISQMWTQSHANGVQNRIESHPNRMNSSQSDQKSYKALMAHAKKTLQNSTGDSERNKKERKIEEEMGRQYPILILRSEKDKEM